MTPPSTTRFTDPDPGIRVLMGPGPSDVPARVLQAMASPTIGHLDPYFLKVMEETQELLRRVFRTQNQLTIPVSGTGSAGMEACFVNLVEPGDRVLVVVNGVFGTRMCDIVGRLGAELVRVNAEWGRALDPADVEKAAGSGDLKVLQWGTPRPPPAYSSPSRTFPASPARQAPSSWWTP